jgi:hypothetical protein
MDLAEIHFQLNPELLDDIVVNLQRAKGRQERRKSPRQRFPVKQMVAPFHRKMPKVEQFVAVSCRDLSTSGVAFYWPQVPDFSKVIVGLGTGSTLTYLGARVVRHEEYGPAGRVLVGCEFVDRVASPK